MKNYITKTCHALVVMAMGLLVTPSAMAITSYSQQPVTAAMNQTDFNTFINTLTTDLAGDYELDPTEELSCVICACVICSHPEMDDIDKVEIVHINENQLRLDSFIHNTPAFSRQAFASAKADLYSTKDGLTIQVFEKGRLQKVKISAPIDHGEVYTSTFIKK